MRAVRPASEWLPYCHALIDAGGLDELRGKKYSRQFLHAVIDELPRYGDWDTGRNVMPGHAALGAALARRPRRQSRRTPNPSEWRTREQAAADDAARHVRGTINEVFIPAGLLARIELGHHLNGVERLQQWANGSRRREARSVYGLTLPRSARPLHRRRDHDTRAQRSPVPERLAASRPVDNRLTGNTDPQRVFRSPRGIQVTSSSSSSLVASKRSIKPSSPACGTSEHSTTRHTAVNNVSTTAPRRPAPKSRRFWEPEPELYTLAMGLRSALAGQLGYERPLKVAATLKRFWHLGWDVDSLVVDLHLVYQRLGKPFPTYRPNHPARWLGWALKQVDTTVTPPMRRYDAHAEAADSEPCPHGVPGGARHNIVIHGPRCPLCRSAGG